MLQHCVLTANDIISLSIVQNSEHAEITEPNIYGWRYLGPSRALLLKQHNNRTFNLQLILYMASMLI